MISNMLESIPHRMYHTICIQCLSASIAIGQPQVINGWTHFVPSPDSRIIYVSETTGNNLTAKTYSVNDPEINNDPFHPASSVMAFKTISTAKTMLRSGYPDWILFRKGDVFEQQVFGSVQLHGRNKNEPMLIGAYGSQNTVRPVLKTGGQGFINFTGGDASYMAIVGLEIYPHARTGTDEPMGIRVINAEFDYFWIEDCYIHDYFQHFATHPIISSSIPTSSNLIVRRNVFADAWVTSNAHANAMFINQVDTILFEENLLDRNGWHPDIPGADPTGFRHNSYFQVACRNLIFRENIVTRASATGGGHRCGGSIINNFYAENAKNLQFGTHETTIDWPINSVTGEVAYNVILDATPRSFDQGSGMQIQRVKNAQIHHNIVAHFTRPSEYNHGILMNEVYNCRLSNNVIYNWGNNTTSGPAYSGGITIGNAIFPPIIIDSNDIQMKNLKGRCINFNSSFTNTTFSANRYYNVVNVHQWFNPAGNYIEWVADSGETGSVVEEVNYPDPNRNLETYMTSIGNTGGLNEFLSVRRAMHRANWDVLYSADAVNDYIRAGFELSSSTSTDPYVFESQKSVLYPNPARDMICFKPTHQEISDIELCNTQGIRFKVTQQDANGCIPIPVVNDGCYIIRYSLDGKPHHEKLFIHRQ